MPAEPKATTDFDALVSAAYPMLGKLTLTPANYWAQIVYPHSSGIIFEVPLNQTPDMDVEVLQDPDCPRISNVFVCWKCADSVERFFVLVGGGYAADILNFNNAWQSVSPAATVAHIVGVTTRFVMPLMPRWPSSSETGRRSVSSSCQTASMSPYPVTCCGSRRMCIKRCAWSGLCLLVA